METSVSFKQLRGDADPAFGWSASFAELLAPVDTLTELFVSSFDGGQQAVDEILDKLKDLCPWLQKIRIALDHNTTDTVPLRARLEAEAQRLETAADEATNADESVLLRELAVPLRMSVEPMEAAAAAHAASNRASDAGELAALFDAVEQLDPVRKEAVRLWRLAESRRLRAEASAVAAGSSASRRQREKQLLKQAEAAECADRIPLPRVNPGALEHYVRRDGTVDSRVRLIFPEVPDGQGTNRMKKAPHGIQHTKLLLLRHAASGGSGDSSGESSDGSNGGGSSVADSTSGAHLRIVIASANLHSWLEAGEVCWQSPPLPAAPADYSRVLPLTKIGRRVGHPLLKMVKRLLAPSWLMGASVQNDWRTAEAEWAVQLLVAHRLDVIPPQVALVASWPGYSPLGSAAPNEGYSGKGYVGSRRGLPLMQGSGSDVLQYAKANRGAGTMMDSEAEPVATRIQTLVGAAPERDLELWLVREPANLAHANAVRVEIACEEEEDDDDDELDTRLGYLPRTLSDALSPLMDSNALECVAFLRRRHGRAAEAAQKRAADEGAAEMERLEGSYEWVVDVHFWLGGSSHSMQTSPSSAALQNAALGALAVQLDCNVGLCRLRELLGSSEAWRPEEQTCFTAYSPCTGQADDLPAWLPSLSAAVGDERDFGGLDKVTCLDEVGPQEVAALTADGGKTPTVAQLKRALRQREVPNLQQPLVVADCRFCASQIRCPPGKCTVGPQRDLREGGAAGDARQSGGKTCCLPHYRALISSSTLADRREPAEMASCGWRQQYYHAKYITRRFAAPEGPYGWTYVGSHNLSANAWGRPSGHGLL